MVEYFMQFLGRKRMMIKLLIVGFNNLIVGAVLEKKEMIMFSLIGFNSIISLLVQFSGGEEEEKEVAVDGRGLQDLHTW